MNTTVERFVAALARVEQRGEVEEMVALFTENAELSNTASDHVFRGVEGARAFWRAYRGTFGEVRSTFHSKVESDGRAFLEWTTVATGAGGVALKYDGVTVLEVEGDRVRGFRAYFDPRHLGRQLEHGVGAAQRASAPSTPS